eukprot:1659513-Prorocentrum_lima.AAC.1
MDRSRGIPGNSPECPALTSSVRPQFQGSGRSTGPLDPWCPVQVTIRPTSPLASQAGTLLRAGFTAFRRDHWPRRRRS